MIKQAFLAQVVQYGVPFAQAEDLWLEIETAYTEPDRFFHDLNHLEHLYQELVPIQSSFTDWETVLFALVYHDVVYDVEQNIVLNNNEERSAAFAEKHLTLLHFPADKIEKCRQQILATQKHSVVQDNDTNLFTDADLSILGQPWEVYNAYKNNIRQEYGLYPDAIYNAGRRKVLTYFLDMTPLFKTPHFQQRYEKTAKENMQKEVRLLGS